MGEKTLQTYNSTTATVNLKGCIKAVATGRMQLRYIASTVAIYIFLSFLKQLSIYVYQIVVLRPPLGRARVHLPYTKTTAPFLQPQNLKMTLVAI